MGFRVAVTVAWVTVLVVGTATAAEIFRCAGSSTFVATLASCPGGQGERVGGTRSTTSEPPATTAPADTEPTRPVRRPMRQINGRPQSLREEQSTSTDRSYVSPLSSCGVTVPRPGPERAECERKAIRQLIGVPALARLSLLSLDLADYVSQAQRRGAIFVLFPGGKPAPWCEAILNDVLAMTHVEVVDDANAKSPAWRAGPGSELYPAFDEGFQVWQYRGTTRPSGYVTFRWREGAYAFRVSAACTTEQNGTASCSDHRSFYLYDGSSPIACNLSAVIPASASDLSSGRTPLRLVAPARR